MFKALVASILVLCFAAAVSADSQCYDTSFVPPAPSLVLNSTLITTTGLTVQYLTSKYFRNYSINFASSSNVFSTICDTTAMTGAVGTWTAVRIGSTCNQNLIYSVAPEQVTTALSNCFKKTFETTSVGTKTVYSANVRLTTIVDLPLRIGTHNLTRMVVTNSRFQFKFLTTITISTFNGNNLGGNGTGNGTGSGGSGSNGTVPIITVVGNVSVTSAVIEQIFNPFAIPSTTRAGVTYGAESTVIRLLTSTQWPFYLSPTTAVALGSGYDLYGANTSYLINQAAYTQDGKGNLIATSCNFTAVDSACIQIWEVVLQHPAGVCLIAAAVEQKFSLGCRGNRNCTGQDLTYTSVYTLTTDDYCIQTTQDVGVAGTLDSYRSISDINNAKPTHEFSLDQYAYFVAYLATTAYGPDLDFNNCFITAIKVTSYNYATSTPAGYSTADHFLVNNGQKGIAFKIFLNSATVHLSNPDATQIITVEVTVSLKFVGVPASVTHQLWFSTPSFSMQAQPSSVGISSHFSLAPQSKTATSDANSGISSTSLVALVAGVVGGCMFIVIVAAVVVGVYRRSQYKNRVIQISSQPTQVVQVFVPGSADAITEMSDITA